MNGNRSDKKVTNPENSREVVRRNELTKIMKQVIDNINEISRHLMSDVNTLFKRFVYPLMMRTNSIENLLINKGILTKEEINNEAKRLTEDAIAKSKEIDENGKTKETNDVAGEGIKAVDTAVIEKTEESEETEEATTDETTTDETTTDEAVKVPKKSAIKKTKDEKVLQFVDVENTKEEKTE